MLTRVFVALIILAAICVGFGTQLSRDLLIKVIIFRDFFDAALPVLAFGALIKYLCTGCMQCTSCQKCEEKKN
jgi:hypothetical protein